MAWRHRRGFSRFLCNVLCSATAIKPVDVTPSQLASIFATSWESKHDTGIHVVNSAIGIDQRITTAKVIEKLHERDRRRERELRTFKERLDELEARLSL